jgi:ferredoxin
VGHGRCYELAPELFGEDERGHCRILREAVPPRLRERALRAIANCPERALAVDSAAEAAVPPTGEERA